MNRRIWIGVMIAVTLMTASGLGAQVPPTWRAVDPLPRSPDAHVLCIQHASWFYEARVSDGEWAVGIVHDEERWGRLPAVVGLEKAWRRTNVGLLVADTWLVGLRSQDDESVLAVLDAAGAVVQTLPMSAYVLAESPDGDSDVVFNFGRVPGSFDTFQTTILRRGAAGAWGIESIHGLPDVPVAGRVTNGAVWLLLHHGVGRVDGDGRFTWVWQHKVRLGSRGRVTVAPQGEQIVVGLPMYLVVLAIDNGRLRSATWWRHPSCDTVSPSATDCICLGDKEG